MGIPSAPIVTKAFKDLAILNAAKRGMPHERICFTQHPVWGKTPDELHAYIEGQDPVSNKPFMKEVVDALTVPLSDDEKKSGMVTVSVGPPRLPIPPRIFRIFISNNGYTDFLPVILPTEEKVDAMLKGTSHHPDEVVGKMAAGAYPPWSYTVRQVAGERGDGRMPPRIFPYFAGDRIDWNRVAFQLHEFVRVCDDRQRADPRQARIQLRHRRARTVRAGQRHHRPRLDAAVQKSGQRWNSWRHLPWLASATI